MSQRENAGFNAPGFPVGTGDEGEIAPEVWFGKLLLILPLHIFWSMPLWSRVVGVAHPAIVAVRARLLPLPGRFISLWVAAAPILLRLSSAVFGVGHPANFATPLRFQHFLPLLI